MISGTEVDNLHVYPTNKCMNSNHNEWKEIAGRLEALFKKKASPEARLILEIVQNRSSENIALALENLEREQAILVFKQINHKDAPGLLAKLNYELAGKIAKHFKPEELNFLLQQMNEKDAAGILAESPAKQSG